MSEPARWRDQGPDAVRALLRGAPKTRSMSSADHARMRAGVARAAGLAAAGGAMVWLQGAAIGAGLGVLVVGAAELVPTRSSAPPAVPPTAAPLRATTPSAGQQAPSAPRAVASAEPARLRPAARPSEDPPASEAPAPEADSLAEEATLLDRARASLGASPAEALALTETHAARFPGGKLSAEREFLAIDALRRLGRSSEARARGEALLARAPGGLYEERLRKLLEGLR